MALWSLRFRLLALSRSWHTEKTRGLIDMCNYNNYEFNDCAGTDFSKILSSIYGSMGRIPVKARKEREYFCWFFCFFLIHRRTILHSWFWLSFLTQYCSWIKTWTLLKILSISIIKWNSEWQNSRDFEKLGRHLLGNAYAALPAFQMLGGNCSRLSCM